MSQCEKVLHAIGKAKITIEHIPDYSPDYSWLGEWSDYRQPQTKDQKLVHIATQSVLDHHGIWRDERGRIVPEPLENSYNRRKYQYTWHDNGHEKIQYALFDHNRLMQLDRGEWYFFGIIAKVYLDGACLAENSLWGIESDTDSKEIRNLEKEVASDALMVAKQWRANNVKVS